MPLGKRGPKTKDRAPSPPFRKIPRAPKSLDADARRHWNKVADLLNAAGLGSALDEDAVGYYIATWSRLKKAEARLAAEGEVITAVNGYRQVNPWHTIATQALRDLKGYLAEFGLSPKARSKLILPDAEEIDPKWEEFED